MNTQTWIDEAFASGADGFIVKPFSLMIMRQMVAYLLDRNVSQHTPADVHLFVPYGGKPLGAMRPSCATCK